MQTKAVFCSTFGMLLLLGGVWGLQPEKGEGDSPCSFFDKGKLEEKNKVCGSVKEKEYEFEFCSGQLAGSHKVAVGHMILNRRVGFELPAGWEAAGMDFSGDCGDCRFAGYETKNQVDLGKEGRIQYGLKKEKKQEARCYVDKHDPDDKRRSGGRNPEDKKDNSGQELRSRIYTHWKDKGSTINLEVYSRFSNGEFRCRVFSTGTIPVRFRCPELMRKIYEQNKDARVVADWRDGSTREGFSAPQGKDMPNVFKIGFGEGFEAEESRTKCEVLSAKESKVLATGLITVFVPKIKK